MSASSANWKDVLKSQYADIEKLETMDRQLSEQVSAAEIDKILYKRSSKIPSSTTALGGGKNVAGASKLTGSYSDNFGSRNISSSNNNIYSQDNGENDFTNEPSDNAHIPPASHIVTSATTSGLKSGGGRATERSVSSFQRQPDGIGSGHVSAPLSARSKDADETDLPRAPETQARLQKAKIKMLEMQSSELTESRRQLSEQVADLQRQLKIEKEDNKLMKKRVQILESDTRRQGITQRGGGAGVVESGQQSGQQSGQPSEQLEQLSQENTQLKKDLQAIERIVKDKDKKDKEKDVQLKRAMETINKLKGQVTDSTQQSKPSSQPNNFVDRSLLESAEAKLKLLERQKTDLITAFKKQLRLIDVLKRQKAHLEAAKLLSFTEEEFVKALDWTS